MAEPDNNRACERREINHRSRLIFRHRIMQRIGVHETPFGIRVLHFNRLARHRDNNISRQLRFTVRHIFNKADDADNIGFGFAGRERAHGADNSSRAAHVAFHVPHIIAGFEADAARIKCNALADETGRRFAFFTAVPAHDDKLAFAFGAKTDTEQRMHAKFIELLFP